MERKVQCSRCGNALRGVSYHITRTDDACDFDGLSQELIAEEIIDGLDETNGGFAWHVYCPICDTENTVQSPENALWEFDGNAITERESS